MNRQGEPAEPVSRALREQGVFPLPSLLVTLCGALKFHAGLRYFLLSLFLFPDMPLSLIHLPAPVCEGC